MTLVISRPDWREWDDLVDRFPQRTIFHRCSWLAALQRAYSIRPLLLKILSQRECVAIWPWLWLRKGVLRVIGSPLPGWSTPYMGPLFAEGCDPDDVVQAVFRSGELGVWAYAACRIMKHERPVDLAPAGFREQRRFETCFVDLRQEEGVLWSRLKSSCRSRIRKARKSGLTTRVEEGRAYLEDFWSMAQEVFAKSRRKPTYTRAFLEAMHEELSHREELLVVSAFEGDRRVATLLLPHDGRRAMYWAGGALGESLPLAPNNLLHWEAILECRRRGMTTYDFISTKGGPGRFKRTFGPEIANACVHWEASRTRLVQLAKDVYERLARRARRIRPSG